MLASLHELHQRVLLKENAAFASDDLGTYSFSNNVVAHDFDLHSNFMVKLPAICRVKPGLTFTHSSSRLLFNLTSGHVHMQISCCVSLCSDKLQGCRFVHAKMVLLIVNAQRLEYIIIKVNEPQDG